jgi:hypothetical protein
MKRLGLAASVSLCVLLSGCAAEETAAATPYAPYGPHGGYMDQPLGDSRYVVTFRGNAYTSSGTVTAYAYRRARELCAGSFDVISDHDVSKVHLTTSITPAWGYSAMSETDTIVKPRRELVVQCRTTAGASTPLPPQEAPSAQPRPN